MPSVLRDLLYSPNKVVRPRVYFPYFAFFQGITWPDVCIKSVSKKEIRIWVHPAVSSMGARPLCLLISPFYKGVIIISSLASDLAPRYERFPMSPWNNIKSDSRLVAQRRGVTVSMQQNVSCKRIETLTVFFTAWSRLSLLLTQSKQV